MCLVLIEQVATAPMTPKDSSDTSIVRERYEPGVHTINSANPYQGVTVTEGHGKYPVIFEPLQNVQTSRSTYKVTSFIDFTPYLEYFQQFERYLEAFKTSIRAMGNKKGEACKHYATCYAQPLLYKLCHEQDQAEAFKRQQERCMACHMQACLVLKQFEHILNVTEYVNENYLRVKEKN